MNDEYLGDHVIASNFMPNYIILSLPILSLLLRIQPAAGDDISSTIVEENRAKRCRSLLKYIIFSSAKVYERWETDDQSLE